MVSTCYPFYWVLKVWENFGPVIYRVVVYVSANTSAINISNYTFRCFKQIVITMIFSGHVLNRIELKQNLNAAILPTVKLRVAPIISGNIKQNNNLGFLSPVMSNAQILANNGYMPLSLDTRLKHVYLVTIHSFQKTTLKARDTHLIRFSVFFFN